MRYDIMEKETSCINVISILDYLKKHNTDCSSITGNLAPEIDSLEDPESFLRDPNNWISCTVISKLYERATSVLNDQKAAYKMGKFVAENASLGYAQKIVVKAFWSYKKALKHCQKINDQWNRSKKVELYELKQNEATIRLHWDPHMGTTKRICQYNQGVYASLPLIWGGKPLTLKERCCYFDGAPYCEYHLKWPFENRLHEILSRFFTSKSVLTDTIKEMEKDKKIIEEKTEALSNINIELKNEIAQRKNIEASLKASEEKYRTILESIEDGYYEVDMAGNLMFFNDSLCEILGYSKNELEGMNNRRYTDEESAKKVYRTFNKVYTTRKPDKGFSLTVIAKDSTKKTVDASVSLRNDAEGKPIGFRGIVRDISEKQSLEAQLQHARKMESLGLLAGGVAHDLNNILSGIVTYPELLLMDLPEDSHLRKPINTIQESGMRAVDVVTDLLTIAKGVATRKDILNINDIVNEYLGSPEYWELEKKHPVVDFKTELDADLLNISASTAHIKKILMNLVNNAAEAIESRGTVAISTHNRYLEEPLKGYEDVRQGEYAVLNVSDDGSGISSKDLERIFEPFYTKKIMGRNGTGLGLTVVWNAVQEHNGYINVKNDENGTLFELYFPVTRAKPAEEKKEITMTDNLGHGEKILLVDDEERQREIGSLLLNKLNYDSEAVGSGEEAIEYLKKHSVDLIVLDMFMPQGISGRETYEEIIKIRPGQKAIIASGYAKTKNVEATQELGAGKYIRKPYTLKNIGLAIKEELAK
jgi:two-component system, cell cycle sensor histidine kinase and response regulator CckA